MTAAEQPLVTVFQQDDGLWRWRWTSGDPEDVSLTSSHAADSREEAESGARSAYPDTRLAVLEPSARLRHRQRRREAGRTLAVLAVGVCALLRARRARPRRPEVPPTVRR